MSEQTKNCSGCASRRKVIKTTWKRIIKMPWHMNPEWLPSHERDNWIMHRDRALITMGFKGKAGLRKYQRGIVGMMAGAGTLVAGGDCTFTTSAVPTFSEFNIEPTNSHTHARLHSDGDWYWNGVIGTGWGSSRGTWQGGCAVADYDTRWNAVSGSTENSPLTIGTDGVYTAATTSAAVGYEVLGVAILTGTFNLECRDGSSQNLLFTDAWIMTCEVDTSN